jgi:hypothetical protein
MLRDSHQLHFSILIVEDTVHHDRHACENDIESLVNIRLIEGLAREHRRHTEPELSDNIQHIFVKGPAHQVRIPAIAFSAMDKEKR